MEVVASKQDFPIYRRSRSNLCESPRLSRGFTYGNYTVLLSDGLLEAAVGGIYAIPTTFILDRKGHVVAKHVGLVSKEDLRATIEGLL